MENIAGSIEKIFFSNDSIVMGVLRLDKPYIIKELRRTVHDMRFKATIPSATLGINVKMDGECVIDPKWGPQFIASKSEISLDTKEDIYNFLSSGFINGVGPALAQRIIKKFGNDTKSIIEKEWHRLEEVSGISEHKAANIHQSYLDSRQFLELVSYFEGKATSHQINAIYEKYGKDSIAKLKQNPYCIIYDISGIGFYTADSLAKKAGIDLNDPRRVAASIVYALHENTKSGHCYCKLDALEDTIKRLIKDIDISPEIIADKLVELVKNNTIKILDGSDVYLSSFLYEEKFTAKVIKELLAAPSKLYDKAFVDDCIRYAETCNGYALEERQKDAIHCSLRKCFSVITGGPGTGKTSVIKTIITSFVKLGGKKHNVILAAPTGRASRRMSEATGYPAQTIASLCIKMKIQHEDDKKPDRDQYLVIIDEASMIDIDLAYKLMDAIECLKEQSGGVQMIMVGDIDQLPPIGAGNMFRDLVKSPIIPTTTLTFSHRFKGSIATNASRVNHGYGVSSFEFDQYFKYTKTDKTTSQDAVVKAYLEALDRYTAKDVQIIVPMKTRSTTAANELNVIIRDIVNPREKTECFTVNPQKDFRVRDRVMQTVNDKDLGISNGDCGTVTGIEDGCLVVEFDDGKVVEFTSRNATSLILAYAITIHKSQGSEYECVITCFTNEHYVMLQRNLIYTAFSRAKTEMIVFGESQAIATAAQNTSPISRNTRFGEWLVC